MNYCGTPCRKTFGSNIYMGLNAAGQIYWRRKDWSLWGNPHATIADREFILGKHHGMIAVFLHTCWCFHSWAWELLPDLGQASLIFLTPGWKRKPKAHNQNRKNCKMWRNWVMYPRINVVAAIWAAGSVLFPVEILVRQHLELRTCRSQS